MLVLTRSSVYMTVLRACAEMAAEPWGLYAAMALATADLARLQYRKWRATVRTKKEEARDDLDSVSGSTKSDELFADELHTTGHSVSGSSGIDELLHAGHADDTTGHSVSGTDVSDELIHDDGTHAPHSHAAAHVPVPSRDALLGDSSSSISPRLPESYHSFEEEDELITDDSSTSIPASYDSPSSSDEDVLDSPAESLWSRVSNAFTMMPLG